MVDILTVVYLGYSFIAFYFLFFFLLIYLRHKEEFFSYKEPKKNYFLSIVVPCYNEEKTIGNTIESLLNLDYKNLKKIIVVDDCSSDKSFDIIKNYSKKYSKILAVQTKKNTGKASGAKNYGAKFVKTELIGFVDADSYPQPDSVSKMVGFFQDPRIAGVIASVLVKNSNNFLEMLQDLEYRIIVFTRKLLGFVDAIYVTPGPLVIYRKKIFDKIKGFDENNLTEDIEITWHIISKSYKIEMSVPSKVYTVVPNNFKSWLNQRIRWNVGGLQTINKYKKTFLKKGILGLFILPFFVLSWVIGIVGLSILFYRISRDFIIRFLATKYSIEAQTAILTLRDINLTPNVLVFFGAALLILGTSFTLFALSKMNEIKKTKRSIGLKIFLFFIFIYFLLYPLILIISIYKIIKRRRTWR